MKLFDIFFKKHEKPFGERWVILILLSATIILSLMAGYYHATLVAEQKKYLRLEDLYVRVREELGREETQRLIDISREKEKNNN